MPENVLCVYTVEAEYAFNQRKNIIPLRLEADYVPDGWLGPITINKVNYNFSTPESFDSEFSRLQSALTNLHLLSSDEGCLLTTLFFV